MSNKPSPKSQTDPKTPHVRDPVRYEEDEPLTPQGGGGASSYRPIEEEEDDPKSPGAQGDPYRQNYANGGTASPAKSPATYAASTTKTPGMR